MSYQHKSVKISMNQRGKSEIVLSFIPLINADLS